MATSKGRFEWVGRVALVGLVATIALLALSVVATVALTVMSFAEILDWPATEPWALVLLTVGELAVLLWGLVLYGLVRTVLSNESAVRSTAIQLQRLETVFSAQAEATEKLVDLASLSDRAKSLIYREREIETIREVIHHDLMKQDYDTAKALIDSLETQLGYTDEAARLRETLSQSRRTSFDEKIDAAVARVQDIVNQRNWARAMRESKRLNSLFPENEQIASLPARVESAYVRYKRKLLQDYGDAVRKKDIDQSIELLTELDKYLTKQEAAALEESARGVFRARLHNLGVQFAISATDSNWTQALEVGRQIIGEYPNTRMAHEVEGKLDLLQARASQQVEEDNDEGL